MSEAKDLQLSFGSNSFIKAQGERFGGFDGFAPADQQQCVGFHKGSDHNAALQRACEILKDIINKFIQVFAPNVLQVDHFDLRCGFCTESFDFLNDA